MHRLLWAPLVLLLSLGGGTALADDRHGWDKAGYGQHASRFDGPNWRVNVNINRPGYTRRPVRNGWRARSHHSCQSGYRQGINTGVVFGTLFTTGLIGNYSAIGNPGRDWRQSTTVIRKSPAFNRYDNRSPKRFHSSRITRCYETGYDRHGRPYRIERDRWQCR